jgi:hypothetical protein
MASFYKNDNETLASTKGGEFLDHPKDYRVPKNGFKVYLGYMHLLKPSNSENCSKIIWRF